MPPLWAACVVLPLPSRALTCAPPSPGPRGDDAGELLMLRLGPPLVGCLVGGRASALMVMPGRPFEGVVVAPRVLGGVAVAAESSVSSALVSVGGAVVVATESGGGAS